jgi:DNA-binding transcriptional MerR regulator
VAVLSVAELAEAADVSVRTVRFYQSEGLLPAPERAGRTARYSDTHLDRLRLITELRERGLRLSAIRDFVDRAAPDATADDWLDLTDRLHRPWSDDRPLLLDQQAFRERLRGTPDGTEERLLRDRLVERRADTSPVVYLVPSPGLLDVALAWVDHDIDGEAGSRLLGLLQERLGELARELVVQFTEEVSVAHLAEGGPAAVAELLDRVQPLARRSVELLFAHQMERAQRELVEAVGDLEPARARGDERR